jgi:hypothetical protein
LTGNPEKEKYMYIYIQIQNFEKKLTSMSPLGMASKSDGLIQPSITSQPPKFTPRTLELPLNPSTFIKQGIKK